MNKKFVYHVGNNKKATILVLELHKTVLIRGKKHGKKSEQCLTMEA